MKKAENEKIWELEERRVIQANCHVRHLKSLRGILFEVCM